MTILQLGKFYPPHYGGIQEVIYNLTEGLNKRGIKCDVLCSNLEKEYKEEIINSYRVFRTKSYGLIASTSISPQMIFKLREIYKNYDIIHIHHPDPMAAFALLLSVKNKKILLHWHSDIVKQKFLLNFYLPFQKALLKKANKIITTTPKYFKESPYLQEFSDKCDYVPIGIDKNKFKVDEEKVKEIKENFKNKKIIFSLGRLIYYKGFEYLIESAEYLSDEYVILIGGEGPLRDELLKKIEKFGLGSKVKLIGRLENENLGNYYSACDLFVLPSIEKSEAFGIVQIEAMSFGKPVVATKIKGSGVDWVNKDGFSGINVEPKNPKALAKAFVTIMEDKNRYEMFCKNAKKRFLDNFTRDKMVDKIIKIYEEML
ncbi:glycosyltransferase [Caminibacter sp.]